MIHEPGTSVTIVSDSGKVDPGMPFVDAAGNTLLGQTGVVCWHDPAEHVYVITIDGVQYGVGDDEVKAAE